MGGNVFPISQTDRVTWTAGVWHGMSKRYWVGQRRGVALEMTFCSSSSARDGGGAGSGSDRSVSVWTINAHTTHRSSLQTHKVNSKRATFCTENDRTTAKDVITAYVPRSSDNVCVRLARDRNRQYRSSSPPKRPCVRYVCMYVYILSCCYV